MNATPDSRAAWCCALLWLGSALMVQIFSFPLWFGRPLVLIDYEFDYFAGLLPVDDPGFGRGRWLMAGFFMIWGLAHVRLVGWMERGCWSARQAGGLLAAGTAICLAGLPLISPDIFYYLAKGWVESGHGLNAYAVAIRDVPGQEHDPMFANVYAGFKNHSGNYGPAFQMICALAAALGGGDPAASLLVFKTACLAAYAACAWVAVRAAPSGPGGFRAFLFAAHPLLLYTFVTAAHNDVLMAAAMLAAWAAAADKRWVWVGCMLGLAFSIKWASLIITPLFFIHALGRPPHGWRACLVMGLAGLAVAGAFHGHYLESLEVLERFLSQGYRVVRGGLFVVVFPLAQGVGGEAALRASLWIGRLLFAGIWLWLAWRLWRVGGGTPVQLAAAAWAAFAAYFLFAAQVVMEWYFIWAMGFAALQPDARFRRWLGWLSVGVMPWAIFQVKSDFWGTVIANWGFYFSFAIPTVGLMVRWLGRQSNFEPDKGRSEPG